MPSNRVVFSFFRYPLSHAFPGFVLMGFQGFFRDRDLPADALRLLGCGGRDGFSIVPDFNRYCLMSTLAGAQGRERVRRSRLYRAVAGPAIEQIHFVLSPASGHGTWGGDPLFDYSGRRVGPRPFAVLTRAMVAPARAPAFWRSVPGIRRHLRDAPGCAYHIGFGEHPLLTLATFSVWQDLESMQTFAYRHTPHHRVTQAARQDRWLSESLFVRFEIEDVEGDLDRYPKLRLALNGASG